MQKKQEYCSTCSNSGYLPSLMYRGNGPLCIVPCINGNSCPHIEGYWQELNRRMETVHNGKDPIKAALDYHSVLERPRPERDSLSSWGRLCFPRPLAGSEPKRWPYEANMRPESEYPFLTPQLIHTFKQLKARQPDVPMMIDTDLGAITVDTLEEANRVIGIVGQYLHQDADALRKQGVTPFPVERRLNLEGVSD